MDSRGVGDNTHSLRQASAGLYTHLNGPDGRIPLRQFKIGRIARDRMPQLTNLSSAILK
jgi:hypothetical protein